MANRLTGGFDAVMQVSEGTVNRLLAGMHANSFADRTRPSFPHAVTMRLGDGDDRGGDGVRGTASAQIGAPRVRFEHGSKETFLLEVPVRARYFADAGSTDLGEFIHGTVEARYRLADISAECAGWQGARGAYLWVRPDRDSISFRGTSAPALGIIDLDDKAEKDRLARVRERIRRLLLTRFAASPHPLTSQGLRPGKLRTLSGPTEAALCFGLEGSAAIEEVNQIFLGGRNMAVALAATAIVSRAASIADGIRGISVETRFQHSVFGIDVADVTFRTSLDPGSPVWNAQGNAAVIRFHIRGNSRPDSGALPSIWFDLWQEVLVSFDPATESLRLSLGETSEPRSGFQDGWDPVRVVAEILSGLLGLQDGLRRTIREQARAATLNMLTGLSVPVSGFSGALKAQLATFDRTASPVFDTAEFTPDGVILRGSVSLAGLAPVVVAFRESAGRDGYSAFPSWVPGGRIDSYHWSWSNDGAEGGSAASDRFVVAQIPRTAKFGAPDKRRSAPLPAPGSFERLCLVVKGAFPHPATGELVAFTSQASCQRLYPVLVSSGTPLYWRHRNPALGAEIAISNSVSNAGGAANTLVLRLGSDWSERHSLALSAGLAGVRREGVGLTVVILYPDGKMPADPDLIRRIQATSEEIEAPVLVNEDVLGSWSSRLSLPEAGDAWRLMRPSGGVTWAQDGFVDGEQGGRLAAALQRKLYPSSPPSWREIPVAGWLGRSISLSPLLQAVRHQFPDGCPPPPLGTVAIAFTRRRVRLTFGLEGTRSSETAFEQALQANDDSSLWIVSTGLSPVRAGELTRDLGGRATVVGDPEGLVAAGLGIDTWPATLDIDASGVARSLRAGLSQERGTKS